MNKIMGCAILLAVVANSFGQKLEPSPTLSKQDYLRKSKKQKTAAWILLGGGFVLSTTGAVIAATEVTTETVGFIISGLAGVAAEEPKASNTSEILLYTGLASMVGSIPLFVAASKNKNLGYKVSTSIKFEEGLLVRQSVLTKIQFPAIALTINL
jgi:hypothetical protein